MSRPLVVVGASGFGRETLDVVEAHNAARPDERFDLLGVLDDSPSPINRQRLADRGLAWLGGVEAHLAEHPPAEYLLAIGAGRVRRRLVERFDAAGWRSPSIVHPAATLGARTELADGVIVCAGAQVSTNVRLRRHVHVNPNATIGHDTECADFVSVNPAAVLSGEVFVGEETLVGAGAIVLQGLIVGRDVTLGAGCVVTKPVPDGVVVKGVPGVWA